MRLIRSRLLAPGIALALLGCADQEQVVGVAAERDPLIQQALFDQLMVDPDLASQNEGNAALTIGFDHSLPPIDANPELVATIRDEARLELLAAGPIASLPQASQGEVAVSLASALTAEQRAAAVPAAKQCAGDLAYSAIWAARLPAYLKIVPRGAVVEAAGSNVEACRLRVVSYRTPLPLEEVMQFHHALGERAGFAPRLSRSPVGENVLRGSKGPAEFAIHARDIGAGLVAVDIVSLEPAPGEGA